MDRIDMKSNRVSFLESLNQYKDASRHQKTKSAQFSLTEGNYYI